MPQTIRLNGSNYVSDKTRSAFENALKEGQPAEPTPSSQEAAGGNGHGNGHNGHRSAPAMPISEVADAGQGRTAATTEGTLLLESLEKGLAQSFEHQAQTVRVHEQYLAHQSDYATLVGQLLRQQGDIFAQGAANPQLAELTGKVLESLSHSLARFHDLQAETLGVHKQFLAQQAQYSQAHMELIQQSMPSDWHPTVDRGTASLPGDDNPAHHMASPGNGNGHGDGHNGNGHESAPRQTHHHASEKPTPLSPQPISPLPSTPMVVPAAEAASPATTFRVDQPQPPAPPPAANAAPSALEPTVLAQSLLSIVSDKTGYPADMLDLSMDMEADLGIDSIKRVEILGALQERHPDLPHVEPQALAELRTLGQIVNHIQGFSGGPSQPQADPSTGQTPPSRDLPPALSGAAASIDADVLTQSLLTIVSDKTGYPADMLDLSMDMEADLGIDSIKRVEIMGAVQERHPDLPKVEPQALAELRTLRQIVEFLQTEPGPKKA